MKKRIITLVRAGRLAGKERFEIICKRGRYVLEMYIWYDDFCIYYISRMDSKGRFFIHCNSSLESALADFEKLCK